MSLCNKIIYLVGSLLIFQSATSLCLTSKAEYELYKAIGKLEYNIAKAQEKIYSTKELVFSCQQEGRSLIDSSIEQMKTRIDEFSNKIKQHNKHENFTTCAEAFQTDSATEAAYLRESLSLINNLFVESGIGACFNREDELIQHSSQIKNYKIDSLKCAEDDEACFKAILERVNELVSEFDNVIQINIKNTIERIPELYRRLQSDVNRMATKYLGKADEVYQQFKQCINVN